MGQTSSHIEHDHDSFIKWVICVNPNITQTCVVSIHDMFINRLVISSLRVVSDFAAPTLYYIDYIYRELDFIFLKALITL